MVCRTWLSKNTTMFFSYLGGEPPNVAVLVEICTYSVMMKRVIIIYNVDRLMWFP